MSARWLHRAWLLLFLLAPQWSQGGGSGLNVLVVVNQNSSNSVILGNYYCEKRHVPPQNLVRITWSGGNTSWSTNDFSTYLLGPLQSAIAARQLTNQIDYVLLSMDIPYAVTAPDGSENSTTSTLFYGFKTNSTPPAGTPDSCSLPDVSSNSYAASESPFRLVAPGILSSNNFMAIMLTASNLNTAMMTVDNGVLGDSTFPTQTVYLSKSTDTARNIRYATFDDALFNTRLRGDYSMQTTNSFGIGGLGFILGAESGAPNYSLAGVTFAPGAMADNLTSFGGIMFQDTGQLTTLALLAGGASGSYGTVIEPCNYLEKFPSPQVYFYQSRGFTLAESYYQSVTNPFQGILVGEPLSAPFQQSGAGAWNNLPLNALLAGTTNLSLQFTAAGPDFPLRQVDLFLDGLRFQTLTNIGPVRSNLLNVTINGHSVNYLAPLDATIKSVASNLTVLLNTTANSNVTKVAAYTHGDRIELKNMDRSKSGSQVSVTASGTIGTGTTAATFVSASHPVFFDTTAYGVRSFIIEGAPTNGSWLQFNITKTNGTIVPLAVTNNSNWTLGQLTQALLNLVNATPGLQGTDGLIGDDLTDFSIAVQFNLRARSVGWNAGQIQADINASAGLALSPAPAARLDENVGDLMPRNHLYVTAGLTNLPVSFPFNTISLPDGFHELAAVAFEGSHVATQTRATQTVRIQNNPWSATLFTPLGDSYAAVEGTLPFSVFATTNAISSIELFSTGGSLSNVLNQSSATFSIAGTDLGIGLHPFYAIVTATSGQQYRTATLWMRLIGPDSPFDVSISAPPQLTWPATPGRTYDILTQTNLTDEFEPLDTVTPMTSLGQWTDPDPFSPLRFYRIRTH